MSVKNKHWKSWCTEDENASYESVQHVRQVDKNTETIGQIQSLISKTDNILKQYANQEMPLEDMSQKDYAAVLSLLTRTLWKYKAAQSISSNEHENPDFDKKILEDVIVDRPPNTIIRVTTPLLYPNVYAGAYLTASAIEKAIIANITQNGFICIPKNKKIVMVFDRYVETQIKDACDNDNYDQRRVTNTIANILGVSDAFDSMSFYYKACRCKAGEGKSVITVCTEDQLKYNL